MVKTLTSMVNTYTPECGATVRLSLFLFFHSGLSLGEGAGGVDYPPSHQNNNK